MEVTERDQIRNVNLCKRLKVTPLGGKIKNNQIRWAGHLRRRQPEHPIARAYSYSVGGYRPTGKSRKR